MGKGESPQTRVKSAEVLFADSRRWRKKLRDSPPPPTTAGIERWDQLRMLGVTITNDFTVSVHVTELSTKLRRHCVCCTRTGWTTRRCRASSGLSSWLNFCTPPARGTDWLERLTGDRLTPCFTVPVTKATVRRISRPLKNCVTLQTTNFSAKQSDWRITLYMICYLHLPPHRNITNSDTALIHYSCLNIPHTCQIATFYAHVIQNTY